MAQKNSHRNGVRGSGSGRSTFMLASYSPLAAKYSQLLGAAELELRGRRRKKWQLGWLEGLGRLITTHWRLTGRTTIIIGVSAFVSVVGPERRLHEGEP